MPDFRNTTLTILSGQTESEVLDLQGNMRGPVGLNIQSPVVLAEVVNVRVSSTIAGPFVKQKSGGSDVVQAADSATQITFLTVRFLKLVSTTPVAADRVFAIMGNRFSPLSGH